MTQKSPDAGSIVELLRVQGRLHKPRAVPADPEREALIDRFVAATSDVYPEGEVSELARDRDQFFDGTRDPYAETVTALTSQLVGGLEPSGLRERLADPALFAVAVEDLFEPNARSFARNGAWLALIDRSMISALYVCARAIAGRVNLPTGTPTCESCHDPVCQKPSAAITARRWFESGFRSHFDARFPAELWMPSGGGLAYANALATNAETFVLSHEIAHHLAGHTGSADEFRALPDASEIHEFRPSPELELEADVRGAQLMIASALGRAQRDPTGTIDGSGLIRVALGAEHFFCSAELWQRTGPQTPREPTTHPPLEHRRLALAAFWANSPQLEPLGAMAEDLRAFYRGLWQILAAPNDHDRDAWRAERSALARPVREGLEAVAERGHDHFASIVIDFNRLRAASSQLLFDAVIDEQARPHGAFPAAAAAYQHLFCDTPADTLARVDPTRPFLGLADVVDHNTEFAGTASA